MLPESVRRQIQTYKRHPTKKIHYILKFFSLLYIGTEVLYKPGYLIVIPPCGGSVQVC
jgi:hypothetical protein